MVKSFRNKSRKQRKTKKQLGSGGHISRMLAGSRARRRRSRNNPRALEPRARVSPPRARATTTTTTTMPSMATARLLTRDDIVLEASNVSVARNPSGITDAFIDMFINTHMSCKRLSNRKKIALKRELQENIRYDPEWESCFTYNVEDNQMQQLIAKVQCWNKYEEGEHLINDDVSDPDNLAAFNTDELWEQRRHYELGCW